MNAIDKDLLQATDLEIVTNKIHQMYSLSCTENPVHQEKWELQSSSLLSLLSLWFQVHYRWIISYN